MKVYALKGMKRSLSMIYPLEWDNVQSFVSNVIRQPLNGFDEYRKKGGITVVKASTKATFKDRTTQAPPPQEEEPSNAPTGRPAAEDRKHARDEAKAEAHRRMLEMREKMTPEEREEDRQRRERDVRERMEREAEDLFEEVGEDDDLYEDEEGDDEEDEESGGEDNDEDIIEL
jgi:hypothetical protein